MSVSLGRASAIAACALQLGCTFYTSCPTGNGNNGNGNNGNGSAGATGGTIVGDVPTGKWQNITSNLANEPADCGNMGYIAAKPDEDVLFAGVALTAGGAAGDTNIPLWWASRDGGSSWKPLGQGKGSDTVLGRPVYLEFDPDDPNKFWTSSIYGDLGVFRSDDGGDTFKTLGNIKHNDFVTVDFSDPKRQTLLASAHEHGHTLYRSTNGGKDWTDIGDHIDSKVNACNMPWVVDTDTFLFGCNQFGGGVGGIQRSTDGGDTWAPSGTFDGASSQPILTSDGSLYWSTTSGLARSDNGGVDWQVVAGLSSLPVVELPDKRLAAFSKYIVVSADQGKTWKPVTSEVPFNPYGFTYSKFQKAFVAWYQTCDSKVPSDAIARYDFDYEAK